MGQDEKFLGRGLKPGRFGPRFAEAQEELIGCSRIPFGFIFNAVKGFGEPLLQGMDPFSPFVLYEMKVFDELHLMVVGDEEVILTGMVLERGIRVLSLSQDPLHHALGIALGVSMTAKHGIGITAATWDSSISIVQIIASLSLVVSLRCRQQKKPVQGAFDSPYRY